MAKLTIDSRIHVECTEPAAAALREACTYANPERAEAARLEKAVRAQPHNRKLKGMYYSALKAPETIPTYVDESPLSLARGTLSRVREILESLGEEVEEVDRMCDGDPRLGPVRGQLRFDRWEFQDRMLDAAIEGQQGMVLGETGCGKTVFAFALTLAVRAPTLVLVHSSGLMKDWIRRAQEEAGIRADDIGVIGGGEERVRPLTIGMVQTITRHGRKYAGLFGCVIADEIERFAAKSLYDAVDIFPARYRIGVGAEYKRKDGKEFLTSDLFGDELIRVSREEIGDKILDVEHRLFETGFAPDWYTALPAAGRGYAFNQLVDNAMVNAERNRLLARVAAEEVRAGFPVLAFSHRREHVRTLEADLRREVPGLDGNATGVMLGGKNDAAEFERCTQGFRAGTLRFAGTTYQAASVGINLPSLPVGLCATPTHSNPSRFNQTQGRLRRIAAGKDGARLYVPWDKGCFGFAPIRASLRLAPDKTRVLVEGKWTDAREYLERVKDEERELQEQATRERPTSLDSLFKAVR